MKTIPQLLAEELGCKEEYVNNVVSLLDEGNTIPFIARYRKEAHGAMDDTTLRTLETRLGYLRNLQTRREEVKASIDAQGKLTDELSAAIDRALTLAEGRNFMPHCRELLQALHGKYLVVVVTNGDTYAQERRIEISGMAQYFDHVFISEQLGTKKPEKDFYDKVFQVIGPARREHAIMVGDSLSSDMQGGRNAGIPTCFYGKKENADERCDYVIEDLLNLLPILEND